jgi:EpsI family protein
MSIHANWMLTRRGNATRLVLYWYQLGDQTVAGEFDYRFKQVTRSIFERRSDGLVVRLATSIGENEPVKEAQERLRMFCKLLYPELLKLLPA